MNNEWRGDIDALLDMNRLNMFDIIKSYSSTYYTAFKLSS